MSSATTMPDQPEAASSEGERSYPSGLYPWYVVAVLLIVWTLSNIDRFAVNILVLPIQNDLGLSETQIGLLLGPAFTVFYVAAGLPMGRLADQINRRNLLLAGLTVWSIGTFAGGFARSFEGLFAARAIVGLGEACLVPAAFSLIADYFPPSNRGKAIATVSVGLALGSGLALAGGGTVLKFMEGIENQPLPLIGAKTAWELVFLSFGVAGVLVGLLLMTVREPARLALHKATDGEASSFIAFLRRRRGSMFLIIAPYVLVSFILLTFAAWAPTLLVRRLGLSVGDAAQLKGVIVLFISGAAAIFGGIAGDYLTRKRQVGRFVLIIMLAPIMLPGLLIACLGTELWVVVIGLILFYGSGSLLGSSAYAAIQDVVPATVRGRTLALHTVLQQLIGLGIGPTLVALLTEHVLGDRALLNYSILIATIPVWIVVILCGIFGMPHFRKMRGEYSEIPATGR